MQDGGLYSLDSLHGVLQILPCPWMVGHGVAENDAVTQLGEAKGLLLCVLI